MKIKAGIGDDVFIVRSCKVSGFSDPSAPELALQAQVLKPGHLPEYSSDKDRQERLRPQHRWFWKRLGQRSLALMADAPAEARKEIEQLRADDEAAALCAYLENGGGDEATITMTRICCRS